MTRGNARELAVHLIYSQTFTGEEPEDVVAARLEKEYYKKLSEENEVYEERPSRAQVMYLDTVVSGVVNRVDQLNDLIQQFSIGWDVRRISRLTRVIMQLAIFEIQNLEDIQNLYPGDRIELNPVIMSCTQDENGDEVFENIEEVK